MEAIYIDTKCNGYSPDQCRRTLTVGELMDILSEYDEDTPVFFRNDGGYTYGSITEKSVSFDTGGLNHAENGK